ncbi:hypothetical protein GCM10010452_43390 [Crossiella cryophila]
MVHCARPAPRRRPAGGASPPPTSAVGRDRLRGSKSRTKENAMSKRARKKRDRKKRGANHGKRPNA